MFTTNVGLTLIRPRRSIGLLTFTSAQFMYMHIIMLMGQLAQILFKKLSTLNYSGVLQRNSANVVRKTKHFKLQWKPWLGEVSGVPSWRVNRNNTSIAILLLSPSTPDEGDKTHNRNSRAFSIHDFPRGESPFETPRERGGSSFNTRKRVDKSSLPTLWLGGRGSTPIKTPKKISSCEPKKKKIHNH